MLFVVALILAAVGLAAYASYALRPSPPSRINANTVASWGKRLLVAAGVLPRSIDRGSSTTTFSPTAAPVAPHASVMPSSDRGLTPLLRQGRSAAATLFEKDGFISRPFAFLTTHERWAVAALVLLALLLRVPFLESMPNTATADELDFASNLTTIVTGHGPGFFGFDWTPEPAMSVYLMVGSWKLFGMTLFAERLVSAVFTTLAVIPFYALARRAASAPAAFLAAVLFIGARWYILFSRSAWNNGHIVLYMLLAAWLLTLALEKGRIIYWAGWGASLALLLYGYFSGRVVVLALVVYLLIVLARRAFGPGTRNWRSIVGGGAVAAVVGIIVFAPEASYILAHYDTFNGRTSSVLIFNQTPPPGQNIASVLANQSWNAVRSFVLMDGSLEGGTSGRYKAPGDGWLDPLSTLLFLAGLVLSLFSRNRRQTIVLWWCLFLIPLAITQTLTTRTPDGARGLPAVAPMFLFVALALDRLLLLRIVAFRWMQQGMLGVAALVVAFNMWTFVSWVDSPLGQQQHQPGVPTAGYYIWRDYQLARSRDSLPYVPVGVYNTLPPSDISARIFSAPTPSP